jgi:hypothetical protein
MNLVRSSLVLPLAFACFAANAARIPRGTPITLAFDQDLSSKHAKAGDNVAMHVVYDVVVNHHVVIKAGVHETATIESVSGRGSFGKNAQIRLTLHPVRDVNGRMIPLQPRNAGSSFKGSRTDHAALASGAGALILGPIGLVGGIFIKGKDVHVKPGDRLESEVAHSSRV